MGNKIRIISRQSPLALLQVDEVIHALPPNIEFEVIKTTSYGDRHKDISLMSNSISSDFFTRELDSALLNNIADIAIHSAKDLPYPLPGGIKVIALTKGGDKSDSLVSKENVKLVDLPSGSKVGTSSVVRKEELLSLRPDIEVVPIRGTIEERIAQVDDGYVDALIVATCALDRLGLSHRAAEKLPFKTHPLQGNLAITASENTPEWIVKILLTLDYRKNYGKVTLVGFGPGDPELLTIKGQKALQNADVIYFDDLTNEAFLNQFNAEKIYVGKRSGKHSHHQNDINELLYQSAINGNNVVRLKGGDPMLFSHGREEVDFLRERMVEVEIVPGISSGNALASLLQIPLTHRGVARSVAMVLGHSDEPQTPNADTLLYYMGGSSISKIASSLIEAGRDENTPVAIVTNVSLPNQRAVYSSLKELKYAIFKDTPVLLMIGEVVRFVSSTANMSTYDTGTQSSTPLISITPTNVNVDTTKADWLVFTSRYGVRYFKGKTEGKHIASVGPVTSAELIDRGFTPYFESPTESAEGLLEFFSKLPSQHIILPRSDKGLKALSDGLIAQGHVVEDIPVYTNRPNAEAQPIDLSKVDKVIFSSPSAVEVFKNLYGNDVPKHLLLIAKGKTTYETIQTI